MNQLFRFVIGSLAVVPGDRDLDALRYQCGLQLIEALDYRIGNIRGVRAGFLGDRDRDSGGMRHAIQADLGGSRPGGEPRVLVRLIGACPDFGDIVEIDRPAVKKTDDQLCDVVAAAEECSSLHRNLGVVGDQRTGMSHDITGGERHTQVIQCEAEADYSLRVEFDMYDVLCSADGVDITCAGYAF